MKKLYPFCFIFLYSATFLSAQQRTGVIDPDFHKKRSVEVSETNLQIQERGELNVIKAHPYFSKNILETIDTLNYPLAGDYTLYIYPGGYVSGNNSFGDQAKANVFEYGAPSLIKGVLIDFAVATSSTAIIEIAAWDNTGTGNSPGNKIASTTIPLNDIFVDVLNEQTTFIPFDNPVVMTSIFYVGVILPAGTDTLAIFTNIDGDTEPGTAWEKWSNDEWFPYNDSLSWGFNLAHAIFPIIDADVGIVANFFASSTIFNPGETISFIDTSIGDPDTWEWSFEGGVPDTSDAQNPSVLYNQEGLFDVRLIVGNGDTFDTLVREDYIFVTEEIPVESDTLNFPLEGTKTLYEIVDNIGIHVGYICGNNLFNDLAKANYFNINESIKITGLLVDFAVATGGNPEIELAIWNNNGDNGRPGSKLSGNMVDMNTIKSNIINSVLTYVPFDPPVNINHPFYAGFVLPVAAGDTVASWSNEDGDTFPGTAWDKWEDGNWVPISDPGSWLMNFSMAIHPIVEYQTSIHENDISPQLSVLPNPTSGKATINLSVFTESANLTLYSASGEILKSYTISPDKKIEEIDLTGLTDGIYVVKITSNRESGVLKIIKN